MKPTCYLIAVFAFVLTACEKEEPRLPKETYKSHYSMTISGDTTFTSTGFAVLTGEFREELRTLSFGELQIHTDSVTGMLQLRSPSENFAGETFPVDSVYSQQLSASFSYSITPKSKLIGYEGSIEITEEQASEKLDGSFDVKAVRYPERDTVHVIGSFEGRNNL